MTKERHGFTSYAWLLGHANVVDDKAHDIIESVRDYSMQRGRALITPAQARYVIVAISDACKYDDHEIPEDLLDIAEMAGD